MTECPNCGGKKIIKADAIKFFCKGCQTFTTRIELKGTDFIYKGSPVLEALMEYHYAQG